MFISRKLQLTTAILVVSSLLSGCQATSPRVTDQQVPIAASASENQWHPLLKPSGSGNHFIRVYDSPVKGSINLTLKNTPLIKALREVYPAAAIQAGQGVDLDTPVNIWLRDATDQQFLSSLSNQIDGRIDMTTEGAISISLYDQAIINFGESHLDDDAWQSIASKAQRMAENNPELWVLTDNTRQTIMLTGKVSDLEGMRKALEQIRSYHATKASH